MDSVDSPSAMEALVLGHVREGTEVLLSVQLACQLPTDAMAHERRVASMPKAVNRIEVRVRSSGITTLAQ